MAVQLRIVTPKAVAWQGQAEQVRAPGFEGQFGVLPGHERYLSVVRPGRVTVLSGEQEQVFVVGSGFVEVGAEHISLLTDLCEPVGKVSPEQARQDLQQAEAELARAQAGTAEWDEIQKRVELARARLG